MWEYYSVVPITKVSSVELRFALPLLPDQIVEQHHTSSNVEDRREKGVMEGVASVSLLSAMLERHEMAGPEFFVNRIFIRVKHLFYLQFGQVILEEDILC